MPSPGDHYEGRYTAWVDMGRFASRLVSARTLWGLRRAIRRALRERGQYQAFDWRNTTRGD